VITDIKKSKKWDDDYEELYENDMKLEDKIYYGSSSDEDCD
jgi:hypothetical protein